MSVGQVVKEDLVVKSALLWLRMVEHGGGGGAGDDDVPGEIRVVAMIAISLFVV